MQYHGKDMHHVVSAKLGPDGQRLMARVSLTRTQAEKPLVSQQGDLIVLASLLTLRLV